MYNVIGGVWSDTTFASIVPGTEEQYGPFERYEDAYGVWRGRTGLNIDVCEHRLFIVQIGYDLSDMAMPEIATVTAWMPIALCQPDEEVLLSYWGEDRAWHGFFWKGHLFQWPNMSEPRATGSASRYHPTHFMRIGAPA